MTPPDRPSRDEAPGGGAPDTLPGALGRYAGHGMTIALSTALFAWGGVWLDDRLGTEPVFVLVGVFVGFGAGFYNMYREVAGTGAGEADDAAGPTRRPPPDREGEDP